MSGKFNMDRRQFLKTAAVFGVTLGAGGLLTACGGGKSAAPASSAASTAPAGAGAGAAKGGKTIRIAMNQSPWLPTFQKTAKIWEQQTGNKIEYRIFTFDGLLEKTWNAMQAKSDEFDVMQLHEIWAARFYEGDFTVPINKLEPNWAWPQELITYEDLCRWNKQKRWFTSDGALMALPMNGNFQLFYYRGDLYKEAGLQPPQTWDDVINAAKKFHDPAKGFFGYCNRGQKALASVSWDFTPFLRGHGGDWFKNVPDNFAPTINSREAEEALNLYLRLTEFSPPDVANIGQAQQFTLFQSGKLLQTIVVSGGYQDMDDPKKSQVVDKIEYTVVPKPANGKHSAAVGMWLMGVSSFSKNQEASWDFMKWFATKDAQMENGKNGGIPVRQDVYESELANQRQFRYMKAKAASTPYTSKFLDFPVGAQVTEVAELRVNQVVARELKPKDALVKMQDEMYKVMKDAGYKV